MLHRRAAMLAIAVCILFAGVVQAQHPPSLDDPLPSLNLLDDLGVTSPGDDSNLELFGEYRIVEGTREGRLSIIATMAPEWHVYSLTQQKGGTIPSKIDVAKSDQFTLTGQFQPNVPPEVKEYEYFPVPIEEHAEEVIWTAPFELAEGIDAESLTFDVKYSGQVCKEVCVDISNRPVEVKFAGFYKEPTADLSPYQVEGAHVELAGAFDARQVRPGDSVTLSITATLPESWHIYAYEQTDPDQLTKPTLIVVDTPTGWTAAPAIASSEPIEEETGLDDQPLQHYHEGKVTWTVTVRVPEDADPGPYDIGGRIGLQTCTKRTCDLPKGAGFAAQVTVGPTREQEVNPVAFTAGTYDSAAEAAAAVVTGGAVDTPLANDQLDINNIRTQKAGTDLTTPIILVMAFAAGFILNFMPCVLPVIGLKIVAFVHQAGESRARVFALNLWYVAGLLSVFVILAILGVVAGVGWGDQLLNVNFNIVLISVVFAFALSFLGVWEIPLPGFASGGTMGELAEKEGPSGAFFKGILATVLATPCAGPLLVPALNASFTLPPVVTFFAFICVGLGMAFPYILIGAFPSLISFLPKPGAWMDTFKQIMGFVLLGTVVVLLTFFHARHYYYLVPIVAFLMGLWAALWWVARVPLYDPLPKRLRAWGEGALFATLIGLISFGWLVDVTRGRYREAIALEVARAGGPDAATVAESDPDKAELAWQPYTLELLQRLTSEGKTVFVDFTSPT